MFSLPKAHVAVLFVFAFHVLGAVNSTKQALNPQLDNTIGDNGGPPLYYNGSGPVPPYVISSDQIRGRY